MNIAEYPYWRVVPTDREDEFTLMVTPPATVGPEGAGHVMGGVAMAAAIDALEVCTQQPLLWATIQFLVATQRAEELTIRCEQRGGGRSIGQWNVAVFRGEMLVQSVLAAVGAREPSESQIFAKMPDAPPPGECPIKLVDQNASPANLIGQYERRTAFEDHENGLEATWVRPLGGFDIDACQLAIISDFFLGAHPRAHAGSSLDATLRFIQPAKHGWVLSVTQMSAFDRGVAHGDARHFSEDGKLLAISSQTGVLPRVPVDLG
ncbi:MAG: thioesterase family protein [Marinomonas sp.]